MFLADGGRAGAGVRVDSDGGGVAAHLLVQCYLWCFGKAWEIIEERLGNHWEEFEFTQHSLNDHHFPNE